MQTIEDIYAAKLAEDEAKNAAMAGAAPRRTLPDLSPWATLPLLVPDKEVARLLGISRATVWRRVADGGLSPPVRLGGRTLFRTDELRATVELATAERDKGAA